MSGDSTDGRCPKCGHADNLHIPMPNPDRRWWHWNRVDFWLTCTAENCDCKSAGKIIHSTPEPPVPALYDAVLNDDEEKVRELLSRGASPDDRNVLSGYTALHLAAANGNLDIVKLLCDAGAEIADKRNTVFASPLAGAVVNGRADVVAYLLSRGADPCERLYGDNRLLVDEAEAAGNFVVAEMLRGATN